MKAVTPDTETTYRKFKFFLKWSSCVLSILIQYMHPFLKKKKKKEDILNVL